MSRSPFARICRFIRPGTLAALLIPVTTSLLAGAPETGSLSCPTPHLPPTVLTLLDAQGSLEAGQYLYLTMGNSAPAPLVAQYAQAVRYLDRIYPTCRALLATNPEDRVCAALQDCFQSELASKIHPPTLLSEVALRPTYPPGFSISPDKTPPGYGHLALIRNDPALWAAPTLWTGSLQPPSFTGWQLESDKITISKEAQPLIRSDFKLDDAELTGEVNIDEGDSIFLILRSDIVLKFHSGKPRGSSGNLTVKFGYDNLRTASLYAKVPEFRPGQWQKFRVVLQRQSLKVYVDNTEAINATIALDPRISASKLAKAGYFGFGGNRAAGGFRNVSLQALTPWGMQALPRLQMPLVYSPLGQPNQLLEGSTNDLMTLTHNETGPYNRSRHIISGGTLTFDGAPYSQLSRTNFAADHFIARGKVKFQENGSIWFRVNSGLLFGLRCLPGEPPVAAKHITRNFNEVDDQSTGNELTPHQDYTWEIEYHDPVGTFKLDGRPVLSSLTTLPADNKKPGLNQFGISSYNTKAELSAITLQKLVTGISPDLMTSTKAASYLAAGLRHIEAAITALKASPAPQDLVAGSILEGKRPAVTATAAELIAVADIFKQAGDWTTYLELLEVNVARLKKIPDQSRLAEETLRTERNYYDAGNKSIGLGQIGLDNILRTGEKPVTVFAGTDGTTVHIYIPESQELLHYNSLTGKITGKTPLTIWPGNAICRDGFFLCSLMDESPEPEQAPAPGGNDTPPASTNLSRQLIYKVDLTTGQTLATVEIQGRIMDMADNPATGQIFLTVDENPDPRTLDFSLLKVYSLNEATMKTSGTKAIGMFLATDPLGRYLYTGFHASWSPQYMINGSYLQLKPLKGHVDHLVRYRLTQEGPVYDDQKAAPGIGGSGIVCSPDGDTLCYMAIAAPEDHHLKGAVQFGIHAFTPPDLNSVIGIYDAGSWPEYAGFNPINSDLYIGSGNQIRCFDSNHYALKTNIQLPPSSGKRRVTSFMPLPSGNGFLVAYTGKPSGVYFHRFPVTTTTNRAGQKPTVPQFTPANEIKAKQLLEQARSPYLAKPALYLLPVTDITDRKEPVSLESFSQLKICQNTNFIAEFDPVYAGNQSFQKRLSKLNSLKIPATTFPFSWLWESQQVELEYPTSPRLKLNAAQWLIANGNDPTASMLLKQVLDASEQPTPCTRDAYVALAGIYEKAGDTNRTLAALSEAVKLQPENANLHHRLGAVYAAAGYPQSARYHKLMCWHLFPGRPGLTRELISAGLLPQPPQEIKNTATLFQEAAPAVILISHKKGNGTGFLISRNGRALTNYHVINGATDLAVKLKDAAGNDWSTTARVIATDAILDLALIALESTPASVNPLILGDSNSAKTGDSIVAIGNPGMGSKVLMQTASEGIISASNRTLDNRQYLQISAPVNPGNSGGPLLDHFGRVVGMVTLKAHLENVGFAVPAAELIAFVVAQDF